MRILSNGMVLYNKTHSYGFNTNIQYLCVLSSHATKNYKYRSKTQYTHHYYQCSYKRESIICSSVQMWNSWRWGIALFGEMYTINFIFICIPIDTFTGYGHPPFTNITFVCTFDDSNTFVPIFNCYENPSLRTTPGCSYNLLCKYHCMVTQRYMPLVSMSR